MIYREYGSTGKKVSVLGFGGMRFRDGEPVEKSAEIVIRAVELGINYLDTAPYYCQDRSEEIMGLALQQIRQPVYISTKCGENEGEKVRRSLERSLQRLKVDKIDFFHFWCVLSMERFDKARQGGALDAFFQAREEGLVEHVVISTHQPGEEIEEVVKMGLFEGITLGYNVINFPFRRRGLLVAHRAGMGVVTMNPLAGGVIPDNEERFAFLQEDEAVSVTASALRFNMAHPEITVCLSGMASIEEVQANVAAVENLPVLTRERLRRLEKRVEMEMDQLCTGCSYCLPCMEEIPIPKFMDIYNLKLLNQDLKEIKIRQKYHWGVDLEILDRCTECRACEDSCTQRLPILARFEELKEILVREEKKPA